MLRRIDATLGQLPELDESSPGKRRQLNQLQDERKRWANDQIAAETRAMEEFDRWQHHQGVYDAARWDGGDRAATAPVADEPRGEARTALPILSEERQHEEAYRMYQFADATVREYEGRYARPTLGVARRLSSGVTVELEERIPLEEVFDKLQEVWRQIGRDCARTLRKVAYTYDRAFAWALAGADAGVADALDEAFER